MTLSEVAKEIARRLSAIFLRDEHRRRPVCGGTNKFQEDASFDPLGGKGKELLRIPLEPGTGAGVGGDYAWQLSPDGGSAL